MSLPDISATCLITGYLCDLSGRARVAIPVVIRNCEDPLTHGGALVGGADVRVKSGGDGRVQFRLLRGATVVIDHPHRSDIKLQRKVPDMEAVDLIPWLFPHVVEIRNDGGDYEASPGSLVPVEMVAELSDGTEVPLPIERLTYASDYEDVAAGTELGLRANDYGTAVITITAVDQDFLPTNQTLDGNPIPRANLPAVTFPAEFSLTVA